MLATLENKNECIECFKLKASTATKKVKVKYQQTGEDEEGDVAHVARVVDRAVQAAALAER